MEIYTQINSCLRPGVVVYGSPAQGTRELIGITEMFCIWIVVVQTHVYEIAKIHQTIDLKPLQSNIGKLYSDADLK